MRLLPTNRQLPLFIKQRSAFNRKTIWAWHIQYFNHRSPGWIGEACCSFVRLHTLNTSFIIHSKTKETHILRTIVLQMLHITYHIDTKDEVGTCHWNSACYVRECLYNISGCGQLWLCCQLWQFTSKITSSFKRGEDVSDSAPIANRNHMPVS